MEPDSITIQRLKSITPEQYAQLTQLWELTGISNPARSDSITAVQHSLQNTGVLIMAWQHSELLGTAWLTHDYRRLYIHHMAVQPSRQNQGIGNLIMQEAVKVAKELGYQAKLEVYEDNPRARHLYEKYGFGELKAYLTLIKRDI